MIARAEALKRDCRSTLHDWEVRRQYRRVAHSIAVLLAVVSVIANGESK
jgi:hypothetical protein